MPALPFKPVPCFRYTVIEFRPLFICHLLVFFIAQLKLLWRFGIFQCTGNLHNLKFHDIRFRYICIGLRRLRFFQLPFQTVIIYSDNTEKRMLIHKFSFYISPVFTLSRAERIILYRSRFDKLLPVLYGCHHLGKCLLIFHFNADIDRLIGDIFLCDGNGNTAVCGYQPLLRNKFCYAFFRR